MAATTYDEFEYHTCWVIWSTPTDLDHGLVPEYEYMSSDNPLPVLQYCRNMTLAQGRILYNVVDKLASLTTGYLIPTEVPNACNRHRPDIHLMSWNDKPPEQREALGNAYNLVLRHFAGLRRHPTSTKMLAEEIHCGIRGRVSKDAVERIVVDHARRYYTSYVFRTAAMGEEPATVDEHVKPRLRAILREWLGDEVSSAQMSALETRFDLATSPSRAREELGDVDSEHNVPRRITFGDTVVFDTCKNQFS